MFTTKDPTLKNDSFTHQRS